MTIQKIPAGPITVTAARSVRPHEYFGTYYGALPGELKMEEVIEWESDYFPADSEYYIDYDLYIHQTVEIQPGDYTLSFTSNDSGDYFYDLIEGHVDDPRAYNAGTGSKLLKTIFLRVS